MFRMWILSLYGLLMSVQPVLGAVPGADEMPMREQGLWQTLTMIAIALVFFYFILWRPEQKRRKAMEEQRALLKKGDRVSAMGILGTIVKVEEDTVIVRMYDGSKLEFLKAAVNEVLARGEEESVQDDERKKA